MKIVIVGGSGLTGAEVVAKPREVVADPPARYFGAEMRERDLVPDDGAATRHHVRARSAGQGPHADAWPLCDGTHREIGFREDGPGAEPRPAGGGGTTEKGRKA